MAGVESLKLPEWWEDILAAALADIRAQGLPVPLTERGVREAMNRTGLVNAGVLTMHLMGDELPADRKIEEPVTFTHNEVAKGHGIHPPFTKDGDPSPVQVAEEAATATRLLEIEAELENSEDFYGS